MSLNIETRDAVRRALRTFIITTLALFIPGLLGWLNDLTAWAKGQGSTPFPDAHGLLFLLVSAITAGVVALINLVWNLVENGIGKGMLRTVPPKPAAGQVGGANVWLLVSVAAVVVLALAFVGAN